jgi:predicted SnoaL-like aldol condensation-catalyzing enzyme
MAREFRAAAPEGALKRGEVLVDGDLVAVDWELVDATGGTSELGNRAEPGVELTGLAIFRVAGGRITDLWDHPGARMVPEPAGLTPG